MRNSTSLRRRHELKRKRWPRVLLMATSLGAALAITMIAVACAFSDDTTTLVLIVGPELKDCVGVGPMKCLEVNGELFYETIEGFDHEEGFIYRLKIERYNAWPDDEEPPQDASIYGYRLIEVMSKTSAR